MFKLKIFFTCVMALMSMRAAFAFETLNDDVLVKIFMVKNLQKKDIGNFSQVCKHWHKTANSDALWRLLSERDFKESIRQLKKDTESWKDYYFRAPDALIADILAMKEWPKEKLFQILNPSECDEIQIHLIKKLERMMLKVARDLKIHSPLKLLCFFYVYYEMISDLVANSPEVAICCAEAITEKQSISVIMIARNAASDAIADSVWEQAANGIRNATQKGFTNKDAKNFYCRIGEYVRKQLLWKSFHRLAHVRIEKDFREQFQSLKKLNENGPHTIGLMSARAVSIFWLAYLTRDDYIKTYFIPVVKFAVTKGHAISVDINKKTPGDLLLTDVMENIAETTWQYEELLSNPFVLSLKNIMDIIAGDIENKKNDADALATKISAQPFLDTICRCFNSFFRRSDTET